MPTVRTSNGVNVVAAGESHAFSVGTDFIVGAATHRGVIFCHGGYTSEKWLAATAQDDACQCLRYLVTASGGGSPPSRYAVFATTQSGGTAENTLVSCGNANSGARMFDAHSFLLGSQGIAPRKVALVGVSMGFLVACSYVRNVLGASSSLIAGIVGINPVVDLSWLRGRDHRHRSPVAPIQGSSGTVIRLRSGTSIPQSLVDNLNDLGPEPAHQRGNWDLVEVTAGPSHELRRWRITSATTTSLTLAAPGAIAPLPEQGVLYSIVPKNDPVTGASSSAAAARDFGGYWNVVNLAYPASTTDASFAKDVNPSRNPLALAPSDPLFKVTCRLHYNPNDEEMPGARVTALESLWNTANPGRCRATSCGDTSARHHDWKVSGPMLHDCLESLSW